MLTPKSELLRFQQIYHCQKMLSGIGGSPPPLNGKNPLSSNQTYQTKPSKPNLANLTNQTKPTKPNLCQTSKLYESNQNYWSKQSTPLAMFQYFPNQMSTYCLVHHSEWQHGELLSHHLCRYRAARAARVAEVERRHEGPLPKSLDSDENVKP